MKIFYKIQWSLSLSNRFRWFLKLSTISIWCCHSRHFELEIVVKIVGNRCSWSDTLNLVETCGNCSARGIFDEFNGESRLSALISAISRFSQLLFFLRHTILNPPLAFFPASCGSRLAQVHGGEVEWRYNWGVGGDCELERNFAVATWWCLCMCVFDYSRTVFWKQNSVSHPRQPTTTL